jgi:hypothetical protein
MPRNYFGFVPWIDALLGAEGGAPPRLPVAATLPRGRSLYGAI